ncbi:helix-turn-helix domain-containing protein [Tenacibaculum sp. TC6]|uniref:helix-turn-helix domain-containing protein n=1 Tax=Tenacibaculum sp. TC6 TaxID=3423223 RepID=UPI003D359E28
MTGEELKQNRKKLNLSQEELGKKLGLSKNTIYNYENGGVIPKSKLPVLINFFKQNTLTVSDTQGQLSEKDALKVIETIYLHEEELMKYENFAIWVASKRAEEKNETLKKLLKNKLEGH